MERWRIVLHALDRTGPPMLGLSFARWLRTAHPEIELDIVSFRPGDLVDDAAAIAPVTTLLDPHEPWDHAAPNPARAREVRDRLAELAPAHRTLLVSVSAGQVVPYLPPDTAPLVTWVVEQGEDLHWITDGLGIVERTSQWLAGSRSSHDELVDLLPPDTAVIVAVEFVSTPDPPDPDAVAAIRAEVAPSPHARLVVGAGIATHRKAPDLFVEVALALGRLGHGDATFVWIGGEHDPLFDLVRQEIDRLGVDHVQIRPGVPDLEPWLAAADVFVHPARLDAFPLVCLHAAALGTPVVAFSGVGGVTEMFGDSFVGAPYPDIDALAGEADRLLGDTAVHHAVAAAQGRRVLEHFVADSAAPRMFALLAGAPGLEAGHA